MINEFTMNKENLKKLADYLIGGNLESKFSMSNFSSYEYNNEVDCGSVGCAVGHGPFAGIPKLPTESWPNYSCKNFISSYQSAPWDWCFSINWTSVDNTPEGAGKRILHMLEHGVPPNAGAIMSGFEQPCYQ